MKIKQFRSKIMRSALFQCVRAAVLATVFYGLSLALVYYIGYSITWYPSPVYYLIHGLLPYASLLVPMAWLIMLLAIIYYYWSKTAGYIEEIADASMSLVKPDEEEIRLPEELREIETRMNQIKKEARRSAREAKEAEQRKNDLVVNLAHDIRTPLSSVIGYLSLLDEAPDMPPPQRAKYTGITLDKAGRLEQLVDEFFEITRFNLSTIVLNKGKINLPFMLRQIADEFYPMLSPENKETVVDAPEELTLWGDADKLSRVFNNILKNAAAYSYSDSKIIISAFTENKNVVIKFSNQGDPIPAQKLETIFERFFRLDNARSSRTGGAGLGLAIAKEIVDAHRGTISAKSSGTNTTFTVTLPQNDTDASFA